MPRSKPPYPPEFRREAVELARVNDKSVPKLAKDLGRPCANGSNGPISTPVVPRA